MDFQRETQTATFHSPLEDFAEVSVDLELRRDPLTDRTARVAPEAFPIAEEPHIDPVVTDDEGCFFCPEMVAEATPTYPDWMGFDRGSCGEATSFPNLNPYLPHSNVVVLTEEHFRPMEDLTATQFADGLDAGVEYLANVFAHDESVTYGAVNMNFLRPAGSTIVHPHMQTVADSWGTHRHRELLTASREYHDEHGSSYWADLAEAERDGDRWVGSTGPVDWLAAFAPKHHRHVMGLARNSTIDDVDRATLEGYATGLTNVLESYADAGLNTFNFSLFLSEDPAMPPVMSVVARSVFDEYYWSDATYLQMLHDESFVETPPETYAAAARDRF